MKSGDERVKPPRPMDPIDINGVEPGIVGCTCGELVALEYHNAGELVEPACVTFLKFGGAWHRLYFDHGIIFWRVSTHGGRVRLTSGLSRVTWSSSFQMKRSAAATIMTFRLR